VRGDLVALPGFHCICNTDFPREPAVRHFANVCGIINRQLIRVHETEKCAHSESLTSYFSQQGTAVENYIVARSNNQYPPSSYLRVSRFFRRVDNCGSLLSLSFSLARLFELYCVPNMPEHAHAHARVSHARTRSPSPFARPPEVSMNASDGSS